MGNHAIVTSFLACWNAQDVESSLGHLHENAFYKMHADTDVLPFGGEWQGREQIRNLLFLLLRDFDVLKYEPIFIRTRGNTGRASVRYVYRHRPTGEVLEGTRRLVFKFRDGLIVRVEGYHDAKMIEAFMRLTQHRVETNQIVRAPTLPKREAQGSA